MDERKVSVTQRDRAELARMKLSGHVSANSEDHDYTGVTVKKPWGHEHQVALNAREAVWKLHLNTGAETSMHCHVGKDTVLIVIEGEVEFSTLGETIRLGVGERVAIERGVFHRTATVLGAVVIEIESPPDKHDLVRLADKYGREGKGYEGASGA
jgi:mannose-6-phosphate isomerase-like protein (cupin superfamily)